MVRWTTRALTDLKAIHDRIAEDAPLSAKAVVAEIRRKAESLAELPYLGRQVPEISNELIREIPAHSWRIIYAIRDGKVNILTLLHKRRQPGNSDF